ncbi:MAG: hypothetical protein J3R72DRAFT_528400 [Linnemannia gamsii]|nr:MAG: hypothetical protein J3R72DRAFT_528400 [Linnemannia gamsii]
MNTGAHLSLDEKRTLDYLESVKMRLSQLQESIHFFLRSINPETTPGTVAWTELHSKFNVLIAKYLHLTNILNDPRIPFNPRNYTVFPFEPPANDQQVQNLSVLLRTKLFPELEQADEERIKEGTIPGLPVLPPSPAPNKAVNPGVVNTPVGTADEKKQWNAYKLKVTMHDELCRKADVIFEQQRDMVHTKVRYESDDEDDEDDDEQEEEVEVGAENAGGSPTKRERDASTSTGPGNNKKTKIEESALPTDEFLGSSATVRYMDDWAGTLNDVDGYSSGADDLAGEGTGAAVEGDDLFDDSYFEARRREGALSDDDEEEEEEKEESNEEELESLQGDVPAEVQGDEEDNGEDAFMEVVSPNAPAVSSQVSAAGSNVGLASAVETFEEDDDEEEEMEEVV